MSKTNVLSGMIKAIFPILFNAVFFVVGGTDHPTSVWISYAFVHGAYIVLLVTPYLVSEGKSAAVFGYSLLSVSYTYFLIELVTGVTFILVAPASYKGAFLVQLCIAGIYGVFFMSNMQANEQTAMAEAERQPQIEYVKNATLEIAAIIAGISDRETRKKVEKAYDAINASQVKSHPRLAPLESEILDAVASLRGSANTAERVAIQKQAEALLQMVNERNRQLRLLGT